jgi:hypothetical protein
MHSGCRHHDEPIAEASDSSADYDNPRRCFDESSRKLTYGFLLEIGDSVPFVM